MSRWYGIDNRDRMIRQTLFVCPRCGCDRDGTEYEPRRWATLLGLPVVPLNAAEHMITCNVCDHRCDMGVLEIPTTEVLAGYLSDATRHGVVAVVRAGGAAAMATSHPPSVGSPSTRCCPTDSGTTTSVSTAT